MNLTLVEPMQGMSEDETDNDEPEIKIDEEKNEAARKAREERAEKLRKMMEDDGKTFPLPFLNYFLTCHRRGDARCTSRRRGRTSDDNRQGGHS